MTEQPSGPPCDMCKAEPALMSVMNLSDYSTLYVGGACLVPFHVSALQELTGMQPDLTPAEGATADSPPQPPQDAPEQPPAAPVDADPPAPPEAAETARAPRRRPR